MQYPESKTNEYIIKNAAQFIQVQSKYELKCDFSEESLEVVNDEIEIFADHYAHMSDEGVKDLVMAEVASYLIEVARKKFEGILYWDKISDQPVLLIGQPDYQVYFLPFKKVKKLLEDPADNDNIFLFWRSFIDTVATAKKGDIKYV